MAMPALVRLTAPRETDGGRAARVRDALRISSVVTAAALRQLQARRGSWGVACCLRVHPCLLHQCPLPSN